MKSSFEANKVKRFIKTNGKLFSFKRAFKDNFGEVDTTKDPLIIEINGVYHEQSSYISVTESTGSRSQKKPIPMVMALYEEISSKPIFMDDEVVYNGKLYRVTGTKNVQEGNFCIDISLELIL